MSLADENMHKCDHCLEVFDDGASVSWFWQTSARVCEKEACYAAMKKAYSTAMAEVEGD